MEMTREKETYVLAAYLTDNGVETLKEDDFRKLTHINYSFAVISDGKVVVDHLKNLDKFALLKEKYPGVKTLLSIGGWGAGGFSEAASTSEGRATFAETAIAVMEQGSFDGIDVDWEYPCSSLAGIASSPDDKVNFTLLLQELRNKLTVLGARNHKDYLLTIAAGAGQYFINGTEMDRVENLLDYINIMTYDMRGGFQNMTGHHTNLFAQEGDPGGMSGDKAVKMFINAGVPRRKIVLGSAFYGRMWSGVENNGTGLHQKARTNGSHTRTYSELLKRYINVNGYTRHWDDHAKAPYLFNGDVFISYDDEQSLKYKANYVKENDLAGLMFWEYSHDDSHTLVDVLHRSLL